MGKLRERLATEFPEVKSDVLVGEGRVWPVLEYVIENKEIDLIVVGTHGRTGVRKFFLGSVAEDMVRRASCPVLTVGPLSPSGKDHAASFTEILCATDFSAGSLNAVPYAIYLATGYPSHVTLLHVIEPDKAINGNQGKLEDTAAAQMRALMPTGSNLPYRFQLIVEHGLAAPKILEVANRRGADLIVLGARRVGRIAGGATHLASVANTVIAYSTCPVLTVRG